MELQQVSNIALSMDTIAEIHTEEQDVVTYPDYSPDLASLYLAGIHRIQGSMSTSARSLGTKRPVMGGRRTVRRRQQMSDGSLSPDRRGVGGTPEDGTESPRTATSLSNHQDTGRDGEHEGIIDTDDEGNTSGHGHITQKTYRQACETLDTPVIQTFLRGLTSEEISLRYHIVGRKGAKACAAALMDNGVVESLDLQGNHLGRHGAVLICAMLRENIFITDLCLAENNLGHHGLRHVCDVLKVNEVVRSLNLSGNGFSDEDAALVVDMLRENVTLRELDLSHNNFWEKGGEILASGLVGNPDLESLNLSWNHLRGSGAEAIGHALEKNIGLKRLNLAWNGFHKEGCSSLGQALEINSTLEFLDLTCNRIGPKCLEKLLKGIKINTSLTHLNLSKNPLTEEGAMKVINFIESLKESPLMVVDVTGHDLPKEFALHSSRINANSLGVQVKLGPTSGGVDTLDIQQDTMFVMEDPLLVFLEYLRIQDQTILEVCQDVSGDFLTKSQLKLELLKAEVPLSQKKMDMFLDRLDWENKDRISKTELVEEQKHYMQHVQTVLNGGNDEEGMARTANETNENSSASHIKDLYESERTYIKSPQVDLKLSDISRINSKLNTYLRIRRYFWSCKAGIKSIELNPVPRKTDEDYKSILPQKQIIGYRT